MASEVPKFYVVCFRDVGRYSGTISLVLWTTVGLLADWTLQVCIAVFCMASWKTLDVTERNEDIICETRSPGLFRHYCAENRKTVVDEYFFPGSKVAGEKLEWFGESGKCWVSMHSAERCA